MTSTKSQNPWSAFRCLRSFPGIGGIVFALALATNTQAQTVTNFSNFSESGNLLTSPNIREQTFAPSGANVTVTSATTTTTVGQETYLSNEFPTLTTGDRITVNLTSATFAGGAADTIALAVASTETPTTRTNILVWGWRTGTMYLTNFDASGGNVTATPAYPASGRPDSVFIERTASGWTLGSVKGTTVTIFYTNITTVLSTTITADGEAFGLWSDMRLDSGTWTVSNLVVTPPANMFTNWIANPIFGIAPADRGLLADPDKDNLPNGIEAWFGTHPGQFSAGLSGPSTNGTVTTFTHPKNSTPPSDLGISYQWSPDLTNWYAGDGVAGPPGGATVNVQALTVAGTTTATATASTSLGRVFLRAGVKQN